jgi:hypothetical protein
MADQGPKSAFEIAMERLRLKDAQEGIEQRPRTERQKAAIAEVRSLCEAKLAQEQVMYQSAATLAPDPQVLAELHEQYQRERARITRERDEEIERIRNEPEAP